MNTNAAADGHAHAAVCISIVISMTDGVANDVVSRGRCTWDHWEKPADVKDGSRQVLKDIEKC